MKKVPLPFSPIGINCLPWFVAKEARLYEKNGIDVDPVFIGASSALFQSMLSGAADMAGSGGPSVISNVLQGGDIIHVTPWFRVSPSQSWSSRRSRSRKI
jgi:ABC-type nitrate/sulfonate/bicarbonate transport system substrate-binding protein